MRRRLTLSTSAKTRSHLGRVVENMMEEEEEEALLKGAASQAHGHCQLLFVSMTDNTASSSSSTFHFQH
jgi:hypothetical protein